jgi:hypothetical protein
LERPTCERASMDFTESCETSLDWKSGPGICFCLLMPKETDSKSYTGTGRVFGVVPRQTLHNARKGYLRVLYPYHPYYRQTFEVFGSNGGLRDLVYIRMPNNATRGIPAWMFDEAICASIRCADRATIDCRALLRLAQLLDLQAESRSIGAHESSIPESKIASKISPSSADTGAGQVAFKRSDAKRRSK